MSMFIKVSQLMAISLLLLVGCSGKSNNTNDSNLPGSSSNIPTDQPAPDQNPTDSAIVGSTSVAESDISGCWSGGPPYDGVSYVRATYVFESNNTYSAKQEIRSQHVNQDFTWTGRWEHDGDYIVAVSDDDGKKATFKILSDYELNQVGQNFNYSRC